jgi:hypothetical protein
MKRLLIYGIPVVLLAAVVVPSLRRAAGTPDEAGGLGDVRTLMAAERSYAAANGGYFDDPACLAAPARCLPAGNPPPSFIDAAWSGLGPRLGYEFRFEAGPAVQAAPAGVSKSSLTAYAVVARPAAAAPGRRAYCGDSSGRVCARADGTMPGIIDGRCPEACETLR